jgi:hypothetical protein
MTHLARVVTFLVLISAYAMAQTKVLVCFDAPNWIVMGKPLFRNLPFEQLPPDQEGIDLISPHDTKLAQIFRPSESMLHYRTIMDPSGVDLLLPLRLESSRLCQMADRAPNGSIQLH